METVTDRAALLQLRDRLKTATGPVRALDEAIAVAFGWKWVGISPRYWLEPGMDVKAFQNNPDTLDPRVHLAMPLPFSRSTSAAETLLPAECRSWIFAKGRLTPEEPAYGVACYFDEAGDHEAAKAEHNGSLALCICLARVEYELSRSPA